MLSERVVSEGRGKVAKKLRRRNNTERKILVKTVDLFYKNGFTKASIRDIAKAVGVSNATVYLYFKKKDDLLFRIIDNVGEELLGLLHTVIEHNNSNGTVECLRAMIIEQVNFSINSYKKMRIYLEEQYQLPPYLRREAYKRHRQIYDVYYERICDLETEGVLAKTDKTVITFSIFASMNWLYRWFDPKGQLSVGEVTQDIVKVLFSGILK